MCPFKIRNVVAEQQSVMQICLPTPEKIILDLLAKSSINVNARTRSFIETRIPRSPGNVSQIVVVILDELNANTTLLLAYE